MIAPARATRVGEHEDALVIVLKSSGLRQVGAARAIFHTQTPFAVRADAGDDAAGPSGDFGDLLGAEPLDDLIEGALHRGQCAEMLDETIAAFDRIAALHGLAIPHHRPRAQVTLAIGIGFEELDRKSTRLNSSH